MRVGSLLYYLRHYPPGFLVKKALRVYFGSFLEKWEEKSWKKSVRVPEIRTIPHGVFRPEKKVVDRIMEGKIRLLGTEVELGRWKTDPETGYEYPLVFYKGPRREHYKRRGLVGKADVKRVWEPSRFQWAVILALAWRSYGEKAYLDKLVELIRSWEKDNPFPYGPNWVTPMEVAIRGINLYYALSVAWNGLKGKDKEEINRMLYLHGLYLWKNRREEWSPTVRSNHYLSDLLGLLYLGYAFNQANWYRWARKELEREMFVQVFPEGVSWEVSLSYHRLNTEIFTLAAQLTRISGDPFPDPWMERLRRMHWFLRVTMRPDGLWPLIGDSDDGRILDLDFGERRDFSQVLDGGVVLFRDGGLKTREHVGPWARLVFGEEVKVWEGIEEREVEGEFLYPRSGYAVVRWGNFYFITRCGEMGLNGTGGHAHNDLLSFELYWGEPFIVDPGTYTYTGDPGKRNLYRSTKAHSTLSVDEREQNPLTQDLFKLFDRAHGRISMRKTGKEVEIVGEHRGFYPVVHRRRFRIGGEKVEIEDEIRGKGVHLLEFYFISPVEIWASGGRAVFQGKRGKLVLEYPEKLESEVSPFDLSPSYGVLVPGYRLRLSTREELPVRFRFTLRRM